MPLAFIATQVMYQPVSWAPVASALATEMRKVALFPLTSESHVTANLGMVDATVIMLLKVREIYPLLFVRLSAIRSFVFSLQTFPFIIFSQ